MDTAMTLARPTSASTAPPTVDVVVPVYNEETALTGERACASTGSCPPSSRSAGGSPIVDNASTDRTAEIGTRAGRAARRRARSSTSTARVAGWRCARRGPPATRRCVAYTDVDLSTGLDALLPLVAPLVSGHSDVAIGSRLAAGVERRPWPAARGDLAHLQPDPAHAVRQPRSTTRSAGSRRCAPTSPAGSCPRSSTTAGSSTPSCCCWPSTTGCASTRCRSTGSTTPTAGSTSPAPPSTTCGARPAWRCASPGVKARSTSAPHGRSSFADDGGRHLITFAGIGAVEHRRLVGPVPVAASRPSGRWPRSSWPWRPRRSATPGPTGGGRSPGAAAGVGRHVVAGHGGDRGRHRLVGAGRVGRPRAGWWAGRRARSRWPWPGA